MKKCERCRLKTYVNVALYLCVFMLLMICVHMAENNRSMGISVSLSEQTTLKMMEKLSKKDSFRIKVTGYHPGSGGINSDSNPSMTSTMTRHKAGRTCAISTELVEAGWLGKEIYIEGYGMMIANDRLNKNIEGKQIDLCKGSLNDALAVGNNYNVLSTLVDRKYINEK